MKRAPQRVRVYETLHSLNQAFEQVLADLERLQEFRFFRRELLGHFQVVIKETRAWANLELVGVMQGREQDDWARFGRLRRQWEKRYEDQDDVTAAIELTRKLPKSAGQRRAKGGKGANHG